MTFACTAIGDDGAPPPEQVGAKIDGFLESHWSANDVRPAQISDDASFLRRVTLDLAGRIPTTSELDEFLDHTSDDKRHQVIERLIHGPEFPLHFGNVLDQMIQTRYAGNADFVDYLRRSVRDDRPWDVIFREIMLGPWDTELKKPANLFLDRRAKTSDVLTVDAARVFFGVDISCAQCHDHPLVDDWTQDHFYGMVAFFDRTTGGNGTVGEENEGEVTFLGSDGTEKVARPMFLSGEVAAEPSTSVADSGEQQTHGFTRREQLVNLALDEVVFFSRAIVNRMWDYFLGRGLIDPVDQMHSGNDSAVPGLLEWLAEDFAASGYDLKRLIAAIVSSRAYQLSSKWEQDAPIPDRTLYAAAAVRPLSPRQLTFSLVLATGNGDLSEPDEIQSRVERYAGVPGLLRVEQYLTIESRCAELRGAFDARRPGFQSSVSEALYVSNNPAIEQLLSPRDDNLAARLGEIDQTRLLVATAIRTILSRPPREDELARLSDWIEHRRDDGRHVVEDLIWALVSSAEFRFNH